MTIHDEISDDDVLRAAARSLSSIPAANPPKVAAIMARGRSRRRRQAAGLGLAGAAAATVTALGLTGALGSAAPAAATGTIHTAAFTLSRNADGTATLRLNQQQLFNPATLERALARDGIPALVKVGTYCWSEPAPPSPFRLGVISLQNPDGSPVATSPGRKHPVPGDAVTVIHPAKIPAGTELFFDYVPRGSVHALIGGLVSTSSYHCTQGVPPQGRTTR